MKHKVMADDKPYTQKRISTDLATLKAGNYDLSLSETLLHSFQQLPAARITILCDCTDGEINVNLPATGGATSGTKYVQLIFVKILGSKDNKAIFRPLDGDLLNGSSEGRSISSVGEARSLFNLYANFWNG